MEKVLLTMCLIAMLAGCNEAQKISATGVKPLNQQLAPTPQDWKDAYGDTIETQLAFNMRISRRNEILIADMVNKMHPTDVNDPNNLKARIEKLEAKNETNTACEIPYPVCPVCEDDFFSKNLDGIFFSTAYFGAIPDECVNYEYVKINEYCEKHDNLNGNN